MSMLSDYQRMVEKPMIANYERRLKAMQAEIERLRAALRQCRTSICGYNIQNFEDAAKTVAAFHKELCRIDAIARASLDNSKEGEK